MFERDDCPEKHTPCPRGYGAFLNWAEKMENTHKQTLCDVCGFWSVWIPRAQMEMGLYSLKVNDEPMTKAKQP